MSKYFSRRKTRFRNLAPCSNALAEVFSGRSIQKANKTYTLNVGSEQSRNDKGIGDTDLAHSDMVGNRNMRQVR